jgi:hypothetical protein
LAPALDSNQLWELSIETYEATSLEYRKEVEEKIFNLFRSNLNKPAFDYDTLREVNAPSNGAEKNLEPRRHVFDIESLNQMQKIKNKFFKS